MLCTCTSTGIGSAAVGVLPGIPSWTMLLISLLSSYFLLTVFSSSDAFFVGIMLNWFGLILPLFCTVLVVYIYYHGVVSTAHPFFLSLRYIYITWKCKNVLFTFTVLWCSMIHEFDCACSIYSVVTFLVKFARRTIAQDLHKAQFYT